MSSLPLGSGHVLINYETLFTIWHVGIHVDFPSIKLLWTLRASTFIHGSAFASGIEKWPPSKM
jgi:hypothetical protein